MFSSITGSKSVSRSWRGPLLALAVAGLLLGLPLTIAADGHKDHAKGHSAAKGSHHQDKGKGHKGNNAKSHNGKHAQAKKHGQKRHDAQLHVAKQHRVARLHAWHKSWPHGWHGHFWWHGHFCWHGHSLWHRNYWWTTVVRRTVVGTTIIQPTIVEPTVVPPTVTTPDVKKTFVVTYWGGNPRTKHTDRIRASSVEEAKQNVRGAILAPNSSQSKRSSMAIRCLTICTPSRVEPRFPKPMLRLYP